ncbi:hypothetical protein Y032_0018g3727 [Ancylostoma ceylanicum]|uniref:Uncharacterized protein n=1 Tax=Ancylostoma ceylanicum TaxID=53326 RepID=A0A016V398_9BILA|nr:hypothetical protein Y032_0018g3727 [Ancylostoma ceylanicum]
MVDALGNDAMFSRDSIDAPFASFVYISPTAELCRTTLTEGPGMSGIPISDFRNFRYSGVFWASDFRLLKNAKKSRKFLEV